MSKRTLILVLLSSLVMTEAGVAAESSDSVHTMLKRGEELYNKPASCWVCHAKSGAGMIGPSLLYGPTAADIFHQIRNNPQMTVIAQELDPSDDDLVAIALYIRSLAGSPVSPTLASSLGESLQLVKTVADNPAYVQQLTQRDKAIEQVQSFESVISDWQRKSRTGNIQRTYSSEVVATFGAGEPRFKPEKDKLYFYENLGNSANLAILKAGAVNAASTQIVVGDADRREVIASYELPLNLRSPVHTTVMSPDGKHVYIVGSKPAGPDVEPSLRTPATLLKADAITLQPTAQLTIGGRLHHGQIFRDRYILFDTFSRDPDGLDVFLFDPETDTVLGGFRDEDLGGIAYTAWTDDEFIYVLMEPTGYSSPYSASIALHSGGLTVMKPFWVAKIDPDKWEVVKEYPYPGYRANWLVIDSLKENMYVMSGGSSNLSKINLASGDVVWAAATGIGPYGASLTADEKEIWVADKGETTGMFGRTVTVLDTETGRPLETLFSGYEVDHILLAPNGKEMWATSNGEGRIYVFDVESRKQIDIIEMPQNGDPHGLVWVYYDKKGVSRVVRDQGGFRGGVNPALGQSLRD